MLPLGPVISSAGVTYSAAQIQALLQGPSLRMRWKFDLLGPDLKYKADLTDPNNPLVDTGTPPAINYDSTQAVKRTLTIKMRPSTLANPLKDLIQVRYRITTPPPDGTEVEWVVGLFMMVPPVKEIHEGFTWWTMTCPDLSQLLNDSAFQRSMTVLAGENYAEAIGKLVGGYGGAAVLSSFVPDRGTTLKASMNWDAGTSYLKAINDLLGAINYLPAYMSGTRLVSRAVPDFNVVTPALVLDTLAGQAQVFGPFTETPDYSNAYNQFLVTGQDPRRVAISAYYENTRPDSPISLRNWHPRLKVVNDSSLADETACTARALTEAQTAARIYAELVVHTVPFPFFEDQDVVVLAYQSADEGVVRYPYLVTKGTHTCAAGTASQGNLQRIVSA